MDIVQFITNNWYLFAALVVVLALLAADPVGQLIHRVKKVSPAQAVLLINREDGVVVDVRDPKEFDTGHILNAVNLPFAELKDRARELEKYKQRPLILSCRVGENSTKGAVLLGKQGLTNVCVLAGGMNAWAGGQLPIAKR